MANKAPMKKYYASLSFGLERMLTSNFGSATLNVAFRR